MAHAGMHAAERLAQVPCERHDAQQKRAQHQHKKVQRLADDRLQRFGHAAARTDKAVFDPEPGQIQRVANHARMGQVLQISPRAVAAGLFAGAPLPGADRAAAADVIQPERKTAGAFALPAPGLIFKLGCFQRCSPSRAGRVH